MKRHAVPLAAAVTVLLWASAFVVIRAVGDEFSPGALAFGRLLIGSVALAGLALRRRRPIPRGRALIVVIAYGVAWFAGYTVVLNWAEQHLDAGTAALLVNIAPVLVAVSAAFLFRDGLSRNVLAGSLVSLAGVAVIAVGGDSTTVDVLGVVLGLAAAVLYASGVLLQKAALRSVDALTATWVGAAAGLLATVPFAPQAVSEATHASAGALLGTVFLGVGPTAIGFTLWAYALARTDAGRMAATTLAVPAVAVLLSWAVLGETPTALGLVGGALALLGVVVTRRRSRTRAAGATPADGVPTAASTALTPAPAPASASGSEKAPSCAS